MKAIRKPTTKLPSEQPLPQHYTEPGSHDPSLEMPGWPGYRTAPGRSGLDPVESYSELGHVLGLCLRDLLFFRIRTRNILSWIGMAVVGFLFLAPLGTNILYHSSLGEAALPLLFFTSFPAILGLLLWMNLGVNLLESLQRSESAHSRD